MYKYLKNKILYAFFCKWQKKSRIGKTNPASEPRVFSINIK